MIIQGLILSFPLHVNILRGQALWILTSKLLERKPVVRHVNKENYGVLQYSGEKGQTRQEERGS